MTLIFVTFIYVYISNASFYQVYIKKPKQPFFLVQSGNNKKCSGSQSSFTDFEFMRLIYVQDSWQLVLKGINQ